MRTKLLQQFRSYYSMLMEITEKISSISSKNKLNIMLDITWCTLIYGASPNNYYNFRFFELDSNLRKTYLTHRISEKLIRKYNKSDSRYLIEDKLVFSNKFKKYTGRKILQIQDLGIKELNKLLNKKDEIVVKPLIGGQGRGVEKLNKNDFQSINEMYEKIKKNFSGTDIIEEVIIPHKEMEKLNNSSVNTIRINTILEEKCHIVHASIRIGNGFFVDNLTKGGMISIIDVDTGIIMYPAIDKKNKVFDYHPITKTKIEGYQIPYWDQVILMIKGASSLVPDVRYIGWDVAISENGPILIEANSDPDYTMLQHQEHLTNNTGIKPLFEKFIS